MGELKILNQNRTSFVQGVQDPDDYKMFYFLLRPDDEPYKGGLYIGQIQISDDYPSKAPVFKMLTPSGRFEIEKAICLTNSHYHPEHSTAAWNINSMIIAFISIFIADDTTGISHIKDTKENRKYLAKNSYNYNVEKYPRIFKLFNQFVNDNLTLKTEAEIQKFVDESKPKPKKTVEEPKVEPKVEPVIEPKVEPVIEPKVEPVIEPKVEPVIEPKVEPVIEPKVEPVIEPKVEPVKKVVKRVVKKKIEQQPTQPEQEPKVEPVKKVVKRVVKKKVEQQPTQPEQEPEEKPVKKVVKRIVKKKVEQQPTQPEQEPEEKPVKKVVKRIVKKKAVTPEGQPE
jgi:ubiquitin-protein ligase